MDRRFAAVLFVAVAFAPLAVSAGTVDDLKAQAQDLISRITQLQELLKNASEPVSQPAPSSSANSIGAPACPALSKSMRFGSRGSDVKDLQKFLINQGLLSGDSATGFFGPATQAAVQKLQALGGVVSSGDPVSTGFGVVGAQTRDWIARHCNTLSGNFTALPTSGAAPLTVKFKTSRIDASIDFGDGSKGAFQPACEAHAICYYANSAVASHTYASAGTYTVTFYKPAPSCETCTDLLGTRAGGTVKIIVASTNICEHATAPSGCVWKSIDTVCEHDSLVCQSAPATSASSTSATPLQGPALTFNVPGFVTLLQGTSAERKDDAHGDLVITLGSIVFGQPQPDPFTPAFDLISSIAQNSQQPVAAIATFQVSPPCLRATPRCMLAESVPLPVQLAAGGSARAGGYTVKLFALTSSNATFYVSLAAASTIDTATNTTVTNSASSTATTTAGGATTGTSTSAAPSCTTPWGGMVVASGQTIPSQPYFTSGATTTSVAVPLMSCSAGTWLLCDSQGNNCVPYTNNGIGVGASCRTPSGLLVSSGASVPYAPYFTEGNPSTTVNPTMICKDGLWTSQGNNGGGGCINQTWLGCINANAGRSSNLASVLSAWFSFWNSLVGL